MRPASSLLVSVVLCSITIAQSSSDLAARLEQARRDRTSVAAELTSARERLRDATEARLQQARSAEEAARRRIEQIRADTLEQDKILADHRTCDVALGKPGDRVGHFRDINNANSAKQRLSVEAIGANGNLREAQSARTIQSQAEFAASQDVSRLAQKLSSIDVDVSSLPDQITLARSLEQTKRSLDDAARAPAGRETEGERTIPRPVERDGSDARLELGRAERVDSPAARRIEDAASSQSQVSTSWVVNNASATGRAAPAQWQESIREQAREVLTDRGTGEASWLDAARSTASDVLGDSLSAPRDLPLDSGFAGGFAAPAARLAQKSLETWWSAKITNWLSMSVHGRPFDQLSFDEQLALESKRNIQGVVSLQLQSVRHATTVVWEEEVIKPVNRALDSLKGSFDF